MLTQNKILIVFTLFFSLIGWTSANAKQTAASLEAEKLMNVMGMDTAMQSSMDVMLKMQIQQRPQLKKYEKVMSDFFNKYMSYESIKPDLIKMYTEVFTTQELKDLNAFYATPTGRKAMKVMPTLMTRGGQLGVKRVQDNIGELQRMIKEQGN